jgi:hypothetical protein
MADTITSWDDLKTIGSKNNWDNAENVYNLIKGTLTGRTAGTPITPASHENMALAVIYNTYMKKAVIDGDLNVPGTVTATGFRLNGGTSDQLLTGNGLYTSLSSIMTAIANKSDYTAPTLWGHKLTSGETNYKGDLTSATGYISAAGFKVAGHGSNVLLADGNTITQSSLKGTDGKDGITSASIWGNAISTTGTTTVDYNDTAYIDNIESTAKSLILNTGTYPVTIGAGAALVGTGANMFNIGNNYKIGTVGNSVLIGNSYITGTVTALNDITASKFITKDGTSSQLVCGDGSLIDKSSIGGSGSGGSSFSPATIWGETLASGGTVKGDLSYVGDIYFDNKYNDTTYYIKETTGVINTNGSLSIDGNLYLSDVNSSGNAYIDGITYHTAPVYFGDSGNSNIHYLNRISDNTGIRTNGDFKADGNIYANKFITDASASDKLVCGDGSLIAKTAVGDTTGDKNAFVDATIWGQNLTSGGTVKGDLAYVDNIYFGDKTSTDITYFTTGTHAVVVKGNFSTSGDITVGLDTDDAGKSINSGALFAYEIYADGILHTSNKLTVKGNSYIEDTAYFTGNTAYFNNSYINNTAYFKNNTRWHASSYITTNNVGGIFAYSSLYTPELHASKSLIEASYTDDIYNIVPSSTYLAVHNGIYAAGNIFTEGTNSYIATQTTYTGNAYFTYNDGTTAYKYYISPDKNGLSTNGYMNIGKTLVINEQLRFNGCNAYIKSMGDGDSINLSGNFIAENLAITKNAYLFGYTYFDENGKYYISESSDNTGLAINGKHILTETDINGWESEIVVTNQSTGLTSETLGTDVNNNMDGVKITYTRNKYGICNIMFNINLSTKFPSFITEGNAVTSEATLIKTACIKNIPGNSTFGGDFIGNSYDFNITGYAIESDINSSENITPLMCEVKFHNDALWISIIKPYANWTIGNTSDKLLFSGSLMIKE